MPEREAPIRIAVAGANGKMGREAMAALLAQPRFEIVATLVRTPAALSDKPWTEYADAEQLLVQKHPDVWLDFTDADSVVGHIDQCVAFGVRPVVGATGYTTEDILRWDERLRASDLGALRRPTSPSARC
ncbi:hypothetical protein GCM10025857_00700 [Alicyclobacillus contaminans]|nr:hypothetical protein GCM10025857_00700 [Alicyclobacillus contaminans]